MWFSEVDWEDGRDMAVRGFAGLKSPGDETGVLFVVLEGGCRLLVEWDGVLLVLGSEGGRDSIVTSRASS